MAAVVTAAWALPPTFAVPELAVPEFAVPERPITGVGGAARGISF
jgi:hypothetical protein